MKKLTLGDVFKKASSNIAQKNLKDRTGIYPIYGASGLIKQVDFYQQDKEYIAVVKDGAGIGRTMLLPAYSSVIGTMQYLLPKEEYSVDIKYLFYAIEHMNLAKYYSGATIPHIYFKDYQKEPINIPDIDTQKEISQIFDKIAALIASRKEQLNRLDQIVKSRFIEMFGDPVYNQKGWETQSLESICKTIVDCPHSTPRYTDEDTGYMCIRTSIVKKNVILWDQIEYISEEEYLNRIKRKKPEKGDIIYTREGAILGIAAIIDRECNVALGQRSMLLSPDTNKCISRFLSSAMNFDTFFNKVTEGVSGSASPHINVGSIKKFEIILPPLDLQNQFADFVAQVDKSKLVEQRGLAQWERLLHSKQNVLIT